MGCYTPSIEEIRALILYSKRVGLTFSGKPERPISHQLTPSEITRLFDQRGIAFVHIPKTGGTSVSSTLYGTDVGHLTWRQILSIQPIKFRRWFKFAILRDPIERFLSAYDFLARNGVNEVDGKFGERFVASWADVNDFINHAGSDEAFFLRLMGYFHFRPQAEFVARKDGLVMVDRLYAFEALVDGVLKLPNIDLSTVPRRNTTKGVRSNRSDLTGESRRLIQQWYSTDYMLRLKLSSD